MLAYSLMQVLRHLEMLWTVFFFNKFYNFNPIFLLNFFISNINLTHYSKVWESWTNFWYRNIEGRKKPWLWIHFCNRFPNSRKCWFQWLWVPLQLEALAVPTLINIVKRYMFELSKWRVQIFARDWASFVFCGDFGHSILCGPISQFFFEKFHKL